MGHCVLLAGFCLSQHRLLWIPKLNVSKQKGWPNFPNKYTVVERGELGMISCTCSGFVHWFRIKWHTQSFLYCPVGGGRGNSTVVSVSVYQTGDPGLRPPRSACVRKVEFYHCYSLVPTSADDWFKKGRPFVSERWRSTNMFQPVLKTGSVW